MESELSPDKEKLTPPVPIKTYQWEDIRRAREAGGYPWTHLVKEPLDDLTAEEFIKETNTRNMSREFTRSRTHSPVDKDVQKILNLDSSPGSSRKHGEEGEDEGVHIPNFSKEVSIDSEDDAINRAVKAYLVTDPETPECSNLAAPSERPKSVSPKSILKRRVPEPYFIGITETREKTKCCHPLVNKIKHLADKTLQKLDRNETEKSPTAKRKKNEGIQEIRQLKSSPGAVRRQKFSAIKLGDSDEMSKTMSVDTPPPRKKKEHIYEDIAENQEPNKTLQFSSETQKLDGGIKNQENNNNNNAESESLSEKKSLISQDPSLVLEDNNSLKADEHVMEKLHKKDNINKEALFLDDEMDPDEPNVDDIFRNQFDDSRPKNDSPSITITEIVDDDMEVTEDHSSSIPIETSPTPSPREINRKMEDIEFNSSEWSKPNSDHEYEIIEKPSQNLHYNAATTPEVPSVVKTDEELSSTTSLERKYLQQTSDDEEQIEVKGHTSEYINENITTAEVLQKDIEERFFVNTPSSMSRTECEVSTSQVDSSALENLPLKRENRSKNGEGLDSRIQQRIKEGTGKLKTQAGKLKTKIQNIKSPQFSMPERPKLNLPTRPKFKMPERPKINLPNRPKFKMPERPKISMPDRPKLSIPDKRKFSLPDRPKFKKINLSEKLSFGDRKKFTLPDRPKFNVPELKKFKMPDRPKINFPSLGRKKEYKVETNTSGSSPDVTNEATIEFEAKTYPRLFSRKKKTEIPKTSSSPTLNREETPPPQFTFTRVKKSSSNAPAYIPDSPEEPREYGNLDNGSDAKRKYETTYEFSDIDTEYVNNPESIQISDNQNTASINDTSPSDQECTHVINEINNDEFFVRPRGISRENIQVREYLSDEIRQAFKIPKNVLALMGSNSSVHDENFYANEPDADPELMVDDGEAMQYSTEDLNDKDDGYYTFPPVRPSRAKRKKKEAEPSESIQYIDESINASMQFSEVDLGLQEEHEINGETIHNGVICESGQIDFPTSTDLHSIHEYANDDIIEYPENTQMLSQTLPMPPKRKKKSVNKDLKHTSLSDMKELQSAALWEEPQNVVDDIIVYRTEHEYIVPRSDTTVIKGSPVPPRRNRSRSSRGTSLCDDDRTSHGAESLTLDSHLLPTDDIQIEREIRYESPGYATVDKGQYTASKTERRSKSKTPPVRRRKSNSSERKYYTVGPSKPITPDRPPRKKSSTSLVALDKFSKTSTSVDLTQYVEIDEPSVEEAHKDLNSGEIVNKMKDRPLPPPPRPPRGSRKEKKKKNLQDSEQIKSGLEISADDYIEYRNQETKPDNVEDIEVSTQTDPLPDDVDFELGMDENLDLSMSSSLRDIVDEESIICKSHSKIVESPRYSRPTSRSEKSFKISDPKISELSKSTIGRTSPTVILVEKRVSSPTRINEREVMLTEASLTVQHIDIDESQVPEVPLLPQTRAETKPYKSIIQSNDNKALERVTDTSTSRDLQLENLVTQRLQVRDLDVGRLNVSELQASKILVSDIEGMSLQVTELDSKSGHISVSGIEFSQSVIDEIVKKFAEITTTQTPLVRDIQDYQRPISREEHTQTEESSSAYNKPDKQILEQYEISQNIKETSVPFPVQAKDMPSPPPPPPPPPPLRPEVLDEFSAPPQRPPPPDLTPLLYSYLQDISLPSAHFYGTRPLRERPFTEFHESQHQSPPTTTRRSKRKPAAPNSESSSDEARIRPSPRRMPPPVKAHEPSITEAGAQFLRVCQNSIHRTIRNIFNTFMSYISGTEDKKDMQMALVIFLVLIAGLIMFGLSDSRTVHHHHWEFFNPPDNKQ